MKQNLVWKILPPIIVGISFVLAVAAYPYLPERIASHWDSSGQVNGYMSKFWGTFLLPMMFAGLYLLFLIIPKIDPKAENIEKFRNSFDLFISAFFVFFLYIFGLTLAWNLGWRFDFLVFMVPAFAALFFAVGDLVGRAEPNWSIGIRTPWTLSSETVWRKIHRLGGKLYKATAVVILVSLLLPRFAFWVMIISLIGVSLFLVVYSYVLYAREKSALNRG